MIKQVQRLSRSKIRSKITVEVELVMHDGTVLGGQVFVNIGERVLDLMNAGGQFFPLRQPNHELILIAKEAVAICKPLDER